MFYVCFSKTVLDIGGGVDVTVAWLPFRGVDVQLEYVFLTRSFVGHEYRGVANLPA